MDDFQDAQESNDLGDDSTPDESDDALLAYVTQRDNSAANLSAADLRKMLSSSHTRFSGTPKSSPSARPGSASRSGPRSTPKTSPTTSSASSSATQVHEMTIDGKVYRQVNLTNIYSVSAHNQSTNGSLVDRGANGGVGGADVRIVYQAGDEAIRRVDIRGVGDHELTNIPICTVGGVVNTQHGPAIAIMNQYAYMGTGKTIHSCGQLEHYLNDVNDKSVKVKGGLQRIQTNDGYVIPIVLACLTSR